MADIDWRIEYDQWVTTVRGGVLSGQRLAVETDGDEQEPTPLQLRTCKVVFDLGKDDIPSIEGLLHDWMERACDAELLSEYEDEDYDFEIDGVLIPRISEVGVPYFRVWLRCELEPEHGIGLACRGGTQFAIAHPEQYDNLRWDDVAELDAPFLVAG